MEGAHGLSVLQLAQLHKKTEPGNAKNDVFRAKTINDSVIQALY